jgi:hypothetical protein
MANPFVLNFDSPNLGGIFQNNEARRREDRSAVQNAFNTLTRLAIEGSVDNDPLYADPIANAEEKVKRYTQAGMPEQAKQARTTYNNLAQIVAEKDAAAFKVDAQKSLLQTELDAKDKQNILNARVNRLGQLTNSYDNLITQRAKLAAGNDLGEITSAAVAQIEDIDKRLAGIQSAFGGIVSTLPSELQSNYLLPPVTQRASSGQPVTTTQPVETRQTSIPEQPNQGTLPAGGGGVLEFGKDYVRNALELGGKVADAGLRIYQRAVGDPDAEIFNIFGDASNKVSTFIPDPEGKPFEQRILNPKTFIKLFKQLPQKAAEIKADPQNTLLTDFVEGLAIRDGRAPSWLSVDDVNDGYKVLPNIIEYIGRETLDASVRAVRPGLVEVPPLYEIEEGAKRVSENKTPFAPPKSIQNIDNLTPKKPVATALVDPSATSQERKNAQIATLELFKLTDVPPKKINKKLTVLQKHYRTRLQKLLGGESKTQEKLKSIAYYTERLEIIEAYNQSISSPQKNLNMTLFD